MKRTIQLFAFSAFILLLSCGPSQRELAVRQINFAKQVLINNDTLLSIDMLDSVSILYPKADVQITVAKNITDELYRQLIESTRIKLLNNDSLIAKLEKNFIKDKTEFDKYMQYTPTRQSFERSWDRSFLQVHLDERGVMYLSSNYMGKDWLKHTGIRVYDGKLQAKTETIELEEPLNHRSEFLDYKWEKVSYMNGKSDSVIQFIAQNPTLNLKCVFLGERYYYILLEDFDIQSVSNALALSNAIKHKNLLIEEMKLYRSKVN